MFLFLFPLPTHTGTHTPSFRNAQASTKPPFSGSATQRVLRRGNVLQQPAFYIGLTEMGQPGFLGQQHVHPQGFLEGFQLAQGNSWTSCSPLCPLGQVMCTETKQDSSRVVDRTEPSCRRKIFGSGSVNPKVCGVSLLAAPLLLLLKPYRAAQVTIIMCDSQWETSCNSRHKACMGMQSIPKTLELGLCPDTSLGAPSSAQFHCSFPCPEATYVGSPCLTPAYSRSCSSSQQHLACP